MIGVSIIICCFNSARRIAETLRSIASQKVPNDVNWEIILIDNNSNDDTVEVAKREWDKYVSVPQLNVIKEPRLGLNYAREKGVYNARYSLILFCDDDNWLEENYVYECCVLMSGDFNIGAVGGWSQQVTMCELPFWFFSYQDWYAVGTQNLFDGDVSTRKYLWGAGICIRKEIFRIANEKKFKIFLSDRKGSQLSSGGDSELSYWVLLCGYKLWYSERLHFKHFISEERLTKEYILRLKAGNKDCAYWLGKYDLLLQIKSFNRKKSQNIFKGIKLLIKHKISFTKTPHNITLAQFMIGKSFKVSSQDDFDFICVYYDLLYS